MTGPTVTQHNVGLPNELVRQIVGRDGTAGSSVCLVSHRDNATYRRYVLLTEYAAAVDVWGAAHFSVTVYLAAERLNGNG